MAEHDRSVGIGSDEELFDQLRQYVDALAARADAEPAADLRDTNDPRRGRRGSVLAMAAVVIAFVGAMAWVGLRDESNSIRSTSDEQTTTTQLQAPDKELTPQRWLMPDPNKWVVTEAYPSQASDGRGEAGVWAWRVDGAIYLLLDGVGLDGLGPLDEATVEVGDGRVMLGWLDGERRLGLQGYGVDESALRSVAASITATGPGWSIAGAEELVAAEGGEVGSSESVQVGYSPIKADGTADLSIVVTGIHRQGTEADMYRELFEASGIGQVTEISVAGQPGFVIAGPFTSYALGFGGGAVSSWSTTNPDVDLSAMVASVQAVDTQDWENALAGVDQVVGEAVAATVADPDSGLAPSDPADDPDLPRYLLPDPWKLTLVTDMGLWSTEERAQRDALDAANAPPGGFVELIWTQGFATSLDQDRSLPFAVPEIVAQIYRRETDEPLNPEPGEGEPFSFAGLDGYIESLEMYDPTAEGRSRTEVRVFAAQGPLVLSIEAPFSTEQEVRQFAESLTITGADLSRGVQSGGDDVQLLLELPGDTGDRANFYGRWLAGYTTDEAIDGRPEASLRVESMSFEQLQLEMMRSTTRGLTYELVPGTEYLAAQYEQPQTFVVDEDGNPTPLGETGRTSLLRYDPDAEIMVSLDLADDLDATIDLMAQLTETDIDTWREIVEPFNAKPLEPR